MATNLGFQTRRALRHAPKTISAVYLDGERCDASSQPIRFRRYPTDPHVEIRVHSTVVLISREMGILGLPLFAKRANPLFDSRLDYRLRTDHLLI